MNRGLIFVLVCISLVLSLNFSTAEYSIDISGLKDSYAINEEINYKVLLLENGNPIQKNIEVTFSSDIGDDKIIQNVMSNVDNKLLINESFSSLGWHVAASYDTKIVERPFLIKENLEVEFIIEGDKLIIRNKGNVRYTRDVQVKIGDVVESYAQNIPVGGEKAWILIAPEGSYNIEITDGVNKFTKSNVRLTSVGTGNAIGAMSEDLQITGFLGGPTDPAKLDESMRPNRNYLIVLTFVGAVFGLGILLFIERRLSKKKKK